MIRKAPQDSATDAKMVALFDQMKNLHKKLDGLSLAVNALLRNQPLETDGATNDDQDDWTLDTDQMIFMLQHYNEIEAVYQHEDVEALRELAESDEFRSIFGDMGFDQAYDRYECMLEDDRAET